MKFTNPWAFGFLITIPLIILMYILKQKFQEREVSSIFLWEQVLKDIEVNTPWQKLKKNLLLFMQLAAAFLIVFALTDPFVMLRGKSFESVILVLDNTGSMNAVYDDNSRLEEAKKRAEKLVRSLSQGSKVSIITSAKEQKVEISASSDKNAVISKIKNIKPSNTAGNMEDSLSFVKSMAKQYENYRAVFYTDSPLNIKGINGQVDNVSSYGVNVSLDYMSHSKDKDGIKAIVRINNRSNNSQTRDISLYGGDKLLNIKTVELKPMEVKTVYFEKIPENSTYLWAEINEKDALAEDNVVYDIVKQSKNQRVLLVSEKNVFIEKILSAINGIELYKTNTDDKLTEKYDLYIYDGITPKELPKEGALLFINPQSNNPIVKIKGDIEGAQGEFAKHSVTKLLDKGSFTVAEMKSMELPYWGSELLKVNGKTAAFVGEDKGRNIAVIGFDLHKSDFPLNHEFPIFMHNLVSYMVNGDFERKTAYYCGDSVDINPRAETTELKIQLPNGNSDKVEIKYPLMPFENTLQTGVYKVTEKVGDKEQIGLFAVNFPTDKESDINLQGKAAQNTEVSSISKIGGLNLQLYLIIGVFMLLLVEWMVYAYGY